MPRKTGTVTGSPLENPNRGKKGALTNSPRVTGEDVETTFIPATTLVSDTPAIPTVLPSSDSEVATADSNVRASLGEKLKQGGQAIAPVVGAVGEAVKGVASQVKATVNGSIDYNPSSLTNGSVDTASIIAKSSAEIDSAVPEMDSAEATKRNIIVARQRNHVSVCINNVRLKQDLAQLDIEQQKLLGLLIDGRTARVDNEKKAVTYHRSVVGRDTEISRLDQDRELLTQQRIRTQGTQGQTDLISEQEQLKIDKLREQNEKVKYEIQNIAYEKEKIKQEAVAKFAAGF